MKYFGTDGIRGLAYDFIDHDLAYAVGRSMGVLEKRKVIVARDTRESGVMIAKAIKAGVIDAGLDVMDIDVAPTPVLAFMSVEEDCFGIMITASHNPYQDNGIKVFNRGRKTVTAEESLIEDVIDKRTILGKMDSGKELVYENPLPRYNNLYEKVITKSNKSVVLDLANGATVNSAKYIFGQISENLTFIGDEPDGKNINRNVGSTHIGHLQEKVKACKADLGFSFDGDGDRVLAVDSDGFVIDGDMMIYIFASYLKETDQLSNNLVVLTKMSNLGIIKALNKQGIDVIQTDVGDKYVVQAMLDNKAVIGGENSGHIINKSLFISGDGVLNAAYLMKVLEDKKCDLKTLVEDVKFYPDRLYNLKNIDKNLVNDIRIVNLVKQIEKELDGDGKVLVRPSGTEPMVRISASANNMEAVNDIIDRIVKKFEEIS